MTARCNGGTSSQLPGTGAVNVIGGGLITAGLEAITPWLLPVSLLVDAFLYEANQQCTSDPPAMPSFDASDMEILALGLLAPNAETTLGKIHDVLLNWAWDRFCQCDSGGFSPTAPLPPPTGTTAPSGNQSQPCFQGAFNGDPALMSSSTPISQRPDFTGPVLGTSGSARTVTFPDGSTGIGYGIIAGSTTISYTGSGPTSSSLGCPAGTVVMAVYFATSTGTSNGQTSLGSPSGVACNLSGQVAVPANTAYWNAKVINPASNWGSTIDPLVLQTNVWCGGGGPGVLSSCCPPDPAIQLAIKQILQYLQNPPAAGAKAYTKGTQHLGLTGTGTITVSGLFGVQLALTAGVPTAIQFPGVPPYERSVGWMSILTGDGMIDEVRITRQNQVWASALAPYATTIGYQLNAGFSMTLTELLPAT